MDNDKTLCPLCRQALDIREGAMCCKNKECSRWGLLTLAYCGDAPKNPEPSGGWVDALAVASVAAVLFGCGAAIGFVLASMAH